LRYYSYVEGEPTLDAYRLSHGPREELSPVFICPFFVVSDGDGNLYNGMRGVQATDKGTTMNMGVYKLNGRFDEQCPYLFPWADAPAAEAYWIVEDRDAVSYVGDHHRLDFGVDEYGWEDASRKVMLSAKRLGQVCTFWVPRQEGIEYPQMLRSHLGKATGTIEGTPVEGLFMLDYIYSRPDAMWSEMGMLTKLHNIWLNWLVEYEDGSYEGGYAWRGRPGSGFAAAHHCVDGVSAARSDARIVEQRTERGTISSLALELGGDVTVELSQRGSTDWPLHTCGVVESTTRGKDVAKSWNYTEFFPTNYQRVLDYQAAHHALYGKWPSFSRLMDGARIVDQQLVYDNP
jgi:hypothetical protein